MTAPANAAASSAKGRLICYTRGSTSYTETLEADYTDSNEYVIATAKYNTKVEWGFACLASELKTRASILSVSSVAVLLLMFLS